MDVPLVIPDDSVTHGQPKACSLCLGSEEGFKYFTYVLWRDTTPIVLDLDTYTPPGLIYLAPDVDLPIVLSSLHGIEQKVNKHLTHLIRVHKIVGHFAGQ